MWNLWKYNDKKFKTIEPDSETERVRCGADVWTGLSVRRCDGTGPDSIPWPVLQGRRSSQKGGSRVVGSWAHRLRSHTGTQLSLKLVSITGDMMNITGKLRWTESQHAVHTTNLWHPWSWLAKTILTGVLLEMSSKQMSCVECIPNITISTDLISVGPLWKLNFLTKYGPKKQIIGKYILLLIKTWH